MIKWAVELAPYGISYEQRRAIKVQAFADFIAEAQLFSLKTDSKSSRQLHGCCTWMDPPQAKVME